MLPYLLPLIAAFAPTLSSYGWPNQEDGHTAKQPLANQTQIAEARELSVSQMQVAQLKRQLDALSMELDELRRLRLHLEQTHAEDKANLRVMGSDVDRLRAENDSLTRQLKESRDELLSLSEIEQRTEDKLISSLYVAKYAEAEELASHAGQALGDRVQFYVKDRVGEYARGMSRATALEYRMHFVPMVRNNSVIVTDFPDRIDAAVQFLEKLDKEVSSDSKTLEKRQEDEILVYEPVSLQSNQIQSVLQYSSVQVNRLPDSDKLVLRGSAAELESAQELLASTDRDIPQIQLRAWLVSNPSVWREVNDGSEEPMPRLPKDLAQGLGDLIPGEDFGALASLTLRSSAQANDTLSACVRPGPVGIPQWRLNAQIKGYQASTHTLQLNQCTTVISYLGVLEDTLSVNLSLVEGEYAVVGSVQGGKMFLVLSFESK